MRPSRIDTKTGFELTYDEPNFYGHIVITEKKYKGLIDYKAHTTAVLKYKVLPEMRKYIDGSPDININLSVYVDDTFSTTRDLFEEYFSAVINKFDTYIYNSKKLSGFVLESLDVAEDFDAWYFDDETLESEDVARCTYNDGDFGITILYENGNYEYFVRINNATFGFKFKFVDMDDYDSLDDARLNIPVLVRQWLPVLYDDIATSLEKTVEKKKKPSNTISGLSGEY